ncbi:hypothetical protein ABFS82_04G204400 [Erythranthe guttata]
MESMVVQPERRRGRKRKNADVQNMTVDGNGKRKMVDTRSLRLVGRYVMKEFQDSGVFLGKIMSYDSGLYRISYEDGDFEDLDSTEIKVFLVEDCDLVGDLSKRKKKLDVLLSCKDVKTEILKVEKVPELANGNQVDSSLLSEPSKNNEAGGNVVLEVHNNGNADADVDSSSDSCEDARQRDASMDIEEPLAPPPELPPSSGHIGVPEEYVSHLLSVHSFLRSFSIPLYLYPFGLDDFVGALNCSVANTLLDSVHVALLRVLKRHIERLSSCGSELAVKCMRYHDWSLLDNITWPVYLVHYLVVMGYKHGADWKEVCSHFLERDYYTLSAGKKLIVLQILCDDVLDSEELRDEIDMREESEVGIDMDSSIMVKPTGGSRRVHPRYSKNFASKNREAITSNAEHRKINYSVGSLSTQVGEPVGSPDDDDGNGDECLICGMDGLLICCDGCPSSYHSRCLGLNKMHMPDGSWYCPECKINATEPKILQGTTLRGGHNFGVDPYGQVFVATCDHLLVLKVSINSEICLRYYNRQDIPTVLQSLYSKAEHVVVYSEICKGIMGYWELRRDILPCSEMSEAAPKLENEKRGGECTNHLDDLLDKSVPEGEFENTGSCVTGISSTDVAASSLTNRFQEPVLNVNLLDKVTKFDQLGNTGSTRQQTPSVMNTTLVDLAAFSGLKGQPADINELSQQSTSSVIATVPYTKRNCNISYSDPNNGAPREAKTPLPCLELNDMAGRKSYGNPYGGFLYVGSSFKTTGYINNYLNGDFAASAAANLAILSSEENQVPGSRSSANRRKFMSDNIALQVKAFSSAAMRFLWPASEKKLVEIPRERCSWCFSCKAAVSSKRGCLLNAAALNATKGAVKVLSSVRSLKTGDGRLPGIATYVMFIEESLSSLLVGPFLNDTFRKRWRKQVEQATTCTAIKILLLELEENVRTIALSGDWMKLVDGCSTQSSTCQIAANAAGSTQKRKPGRRGRKPSAVVEVATDDCQDVLTDFTWWRGGTTSKLMFQRGILPCSMVRKAARQGGLKKIPGIHYVGGNETPKCSRQLLWRAAVEMSRNIAQLALQVRYFDLHVRWSDLVRQEQNPADGKGPETEASAFRNALICEKKIVGHEMRYCVAFGSQKHLPSRLMKNIAEVEQLLDDGKERYWFSETRIPLYLIKEYEEKLEKDKPVDVLSKLQRRQQKIYRKNIFSYLSRKQDDTVTSYCCSCHQDVLHRNAVKCSACQGFCHEQCATSSTVQMNEEVEFLITCKRCCETRAITQVQRSCGSPTSPLLLQGRDLPNTGISASAGALEYSSEMKSTKETKKNKHWGLIMGRRNGEDVGIDFRLKNIIPRGNPDMNLTGPVCRLCSKPYKSDLMYVRCETCSSWYHAEALEFDESKILCVVGYKCCKCRRIKNPKCPYSDKKDKKNKKISKGKIESNAPNLDFNEMNSNSRLISEHLMEVKKPAASPTKVEFIHVQEEDPLCTSLSEVKQFTDATLKVEYELNSSNVSCSGPRKLPVRRHIKQEMDSSFQVGISAPCETNVSHPTEKLVIRRHIKRENNSDFHSPINSTFEVEVPNPSEANAVQEDPLLPNQAQWDVSKGNFDDVITLDYDDCLGYDNMEFEPQTYFSFNELLSDDGEPANGNGPLFDAMENWEDLSVLPDNGNLEISYDQEEPIISVETPIEISPCNICSHTEPCPDLSCQMCGVWIHSHCSPWLESSSWENGWRCGNCREWR